MVKMMATRAQNVNPSILTWARETAGLSIDEAAKKLGLSSSQKSSAAKKLESFEGGDTKPTRKQLLELAKMYHRPLTVFYLNEPPRKANQSEAFRTLPGPVSSREDALFDALLRDVYARQGLVRDILEDDEDMERLRFVGSLQVDKDTETAVARINTELRIGFSNWANDYAKPNHLFDGLRNKIESLGVFVLLISNLGSRHSDISEDTFRGFSIADDLAPFIVINNQDVRRAWSFTLARGLVHLFLGITGVSTPMRTEDPRTSSARTEQFCNDVASELLLSKSSLEGIPRMTNIEDAKGVISKLAEERNLSESMIAYRLQRMGRINREIYSQLYKFYAERWLGHRQQARERAKESEGGPSYYVVLRHRLGGALLHLVGRTLRENQLTHTTAAQILGVKPNSVEPLLRGVKGINGSHLPEAEE